jgi:mono/diheme cytochrome c family protein
MDHPKGEENMSKIIKVILIVVFAGVALLALFQLVPYGKQHTNPAVVSEPKWDTPQTRVLAQRACFDCHSNETTWPWYSNVAPVSWLIQRDVDEGRQRINFSDWAGKRHRVNEISQVIGGGSMPPFYFVWMHPNAALTAAEKDQLISGLKITVANP